MKTTSSSRKRVKSEAPPAKSSKLTRVPRPKYGANLTSVNLGLGFPKRLTCTLKYTGTHTLTSTAGSVAVQRYSCNGLFDPDITNAGHQPLYFDNLMAIYNHYTVIGSKITVRLCPASATTGPGLFAMFQNDDTSSSAISVGQVSEQTLSSVVKLLPVGQSDSVTTGLTWSAKKTFGGSVLGNDNLQGTVGANPTEQSYYELRYSDAGAGNSAILVIAEVQYTAVFDEIKDQTEN